MKKTTVLSTLLSLLLSATYAQSPIDSTHKAINLNEMVISANRTLQSRAAVAQEVRVLGRAEIERTNAQTTADLLINSGAVFVQKSQQGGGSPVLRGFEASRVLLVVDGVRMNNAIYRSGHLQNIITMDNAALERAEILFGPASTVYGTDALGGAICFYTKNPVFSGGGFKTTGNAFLRYGSANQEKTGHLDFSLGGKKLAALTSFTYSDFDDLRMGKNSGSGGTFGQRKYYVDRINGKDSLVLNRDPLVQKYSGYAQYDLMEKIVYRQSNNVRHTLNLQFSSSSNIPRYDRLTDPSATTGLASAEWYYGPQDRLMAAYKLHFADLGFFNQGLDITASYQDIEESRHSRGFGASRRTSRIEKVRVAGLTANASRNWGESHVMQIGLDIQHNDVTSTASRLNVNTGEESTQSTRYPDGGSQMLNTAMYVTHQSTHNYWTFSQGFRAGYAALNAEFVSREFYPFPFDQVTQSSPVASGSLGAVWNGNGDWRISSNLSSGFRMPNIDDLAKVFDSQTGSVIVPNTDIKPEKTFNLDLNFEYELNEKIRWENTLWGTLFRDAIVVDGFRFNGQDTILYDDIPSRVLAAQNKRNARLFGLTSYLNADPTENIALFASVSFTRGEILKEADTGKSAPLDHIPPTYGRAGFRWHKKGSFIEGFILFNGKKRLEDYNLEGEDNLQYAPPAGMPEWTTLNIRGGYRLGKHLNIQVGIDNLLDTQYRYFASGINAPGRNFWITARTSW